MAHPYDRRPLPLTPRQFEYQHQPPQQVRTRDASSSQGQPSRKQRRSVPSRRRRNRLDRTEVGICTKYTLFFENCVLLLIGAGITAIGTYILVLKDKKLTDPLDFFLDPACIMCLVGCFVFVLSFLGCTGALRENTCFLRLFYYVLSVFLLLEVAGAILFFLIYYVTSVRNFLFPKDTFNTAIVNYRDDKDMQNLIDSIQSTLGCCGMSDSETGYEDWNKNPYFNCTESNESPEKCSVPPSCCKMTEGERINLYCGAHIYTIENGRKTVSDTSKIYTSGCLKALGDWTNENSLIVGGVLLGILLPQVFIICLVRNLLDMIRAQKRKWKHSP